MPAAPHRRFCCTGLWQAAARTFSSTFMVRAVHTEAALHDLGCMALTNAFLLLRHLWVLRQHESSQDNLRLPSI